MKNTGSFTFECPYCGNTVTILFPQRFASFSLAFYPASLSVTIPRQPISFSRYDVKCKFCGRSYYYYNIQGGFTSIKHIVRFKEQVIEWLRKYDIRIADLPKMVIGIVEPKSGVFKNFKRRLKRKFRKPVSDRFIEIVFKMIKDNVVHRGVLRGRIYEVEGTSIIDYVLLEYAGWLGEPPKEVFT